MSQQIIMNFSVPPSDDDLAVIAEEQLGTLPEELAEHIDDLAIRIEDLPDETTELDLDLDDPFDLLALYKGGKEMSPGIERKVANQDDVLVLYRRPILDMWCETGDDLSQIVRDAMIEEIAAHFDFSDDDIDDMTSRHYQGRL
jgi:predicted Zn-dependent protease with MMP-like domain